MNIRRFRVLHEAGASYAEIARECRVDWRTVRKYLAEDGVALPPAAPSRAGTQPQKIGPFAPVVEAWLRADITLKASVIHERLVADHGFTGHYQRVKMSVPSNVRQDGLLDAWDTKPDNRMRRTSHIHADAPLHQLLRHRNRTADSATRTSGPGPVVELGFRAS